MENLSNSLSKKNYRGSNGLASKDTYDDVFGYQPKFGIPTLSPRVEDYNEIFGGLHSSRAPCIPVLNLPAVEESDCPCNIRSSNFDYSQVFGGFDGLDFPVSFEELVYDHWNGVDASSEQAWTPAHSGFLSDESDPSACSERNQSISDAQSFQSFDGTKQFHISYHKDCQRSKETMLNGMTHVSQLHAVPGYTFVANEIHPLRKLEDGSRPLLVNNDVNISMGIGGERTEGQQFRKSMSYLSDSSFDIIDNGIESFAKHGYSDSAMQGTFLTASDISLRTQPSLLPPPSRPPPVLAVRKGDYDRTNSKLKASKRYSFEWKVDDSSPLFFDVKIDSSSSGVASAAAVKDAIEKAQAKLITAKEVMERKRKGIQSDPEYHLASDILKDKEGMMSKTFDGPNRTEDISVHGPCEREVSLMKSLPGKEGKNAPKTTHVVSDSINGKEDIGAAEYFVERRHPKDHRSSQGSQKMAGVVATEKCRRDHEQVKDGKVLVPNLKSHEDGLEKYAAMDSPEWQENVRKIKGARRAKVEANANLLKVGEGACEWTENRERAKATKCSYNQKDQRQKVKVSQYVSELEEYERLMSPSKGGEIRKLPNKTDIYEVCESLIEIQVNETKVEAEEKLKRAKDRTHDQKKVVDADDETIREWRSKETFKSKECVGRHKQAVGLAREKILKEKLVLEENYLVQKEPREREEIEQNCKRTETEQRLEEALVDEENEKGLKETFEWEEIDKRLRMALEQEEKEKEQTLPCQREQNDKIQECAFKQEANKKKLQESLRQGKDEKKFKETDGREESDKGLRDACVREETGMIFEKVWKQEHHKPFQQAVGTEARERRSEVGDKEEYIVKRSKGAAECEETEIKDAGKHEKVKGQNKSYKQIERDEIERKQNLEGMGINTPSGEFELNNGTIIQATQQVDRKCDSHSGKLEATQEALSCEVDRKLNTEHKDNERKLKSVNEKNIVIEEKLNSSCTEHDLLEQKNQVKMVELPPLFDNVATLNEAVNRKIQIEHNKMNSQMASVPENMNVLSAGRVERLSNIKEGQFFDEERSKDNFITHQVTGDWPENGWKNRDLSVLSEGEQNLQNTAKTISSQLFEAEEKSCNKTMTMENIEREEELKIGCLKKIEEDRERERERKKDWLAVDKMTCEARERAFTESSGRATMDIATADIQQRAMVEVQQGLEERFLAEKTSMETRLTAERAAVERATTEAQQCALEKALAEKVAFQARQPVENVVCDKFSASSTIGEVRWSFSSSDLQFQSMGTSKELTYSYSSVLDGVEGESPQRCKARLERYRRIAERAGKALSEKKMRDILAQRELAERNRLAESLDAEVKRWSNGKEGNLRALLSTLQYILGPESGWQSIPLTRLITSAAVKKAYRKAALYVHPDKLQQRGASIQQKYICEKVFDLLKDGWKKFNSEEH